MEVYLLKPITIAGEEVAPSKNPVDVSKKTGDILIKLGRASKESPFELESEIDDELEALKSKLKDEPKKDEPKKVDPKEGKK